MNRATFLALAVLDEAIEQAKEGRVPASTGLRLALAHLYAAGDRRREYFDREPYDSFWRIATTEPDLVRDADGCIRSTTLRSNFTAMARAAGAPGTAEFLIAVRDAHKIKKKT